VKNSLLNYQFFKSYRLPLREKDNIKSNVCSKDRKNKTCNNVVIESLNLAGLNFISDTKFKIGENISIFIYSKRIFNNWDFELEGSIVRSFVYEKDVTKIVYGVKLEAQSLDSVLKYFLKDFISKFSHRRLESHFYRACTLDRKVESSEGVELFSLFSSIITDIYSEGIAAFLNDLPKAFGCHNYHIYLENETKKKLDLYRSNSEVDIYQSEHKNIVDMVFEGDMISNMSFSDKDEHVREYRNLLAYPFYNHLQKPIGVIVLSNTISMSPFDSFNESSLRLISQIMSYFFKDHNSSIRATVKKDHEIMYDTILGKNNTSLELHNSLELLKNLDKSVFILGEKGTNKEEIANYLHYEGKNQNSKLRIIELGTLEQVDNFFNEGMHEYEDDSEQETILLKEVKLLTHEQQTKLYDFLKNAKARIITISDTEIYHMVKTGEFSKKLYYLISDVYIHLPPLRNRKNDLVEIAQIMLYDELDRRGLKRQRFSKEMINQIMEYPWPGNIKELRNTIKKSVIRLNDDSELKLNIDIPVHNTQVNKNVFMHKLLKSLVRHSDKSVHYKAHSESLNFFIKNKKVS
jgi:hypothetical protein